MKKLFQNKYRVTSARAQWWDYRKQGAYFLTICVKNHRCVFGKVKCQHHNAKQAYMELSSIGKIVHEEWLNTIALRPDMNIAMGEFVVMPNHFHAVLNIGANVYNQHLQPVKNDFQPQKKNVASIVRGFKGAVTKRARMIDPSFEWQSLYYDSIILNEMAHERISNYIVRNPQKWAEDKFFK
jgi:putative transposase